MVPSAAVGATTIPAGTTEGLVALGRTAKGVFVLSLSAGPDNLDNRWTLPFTRAIHKAFDALEDALETDAPGTAAALLTISDSKKFFSNGIDVAWFKSKPPRQELLEWNDLVMPAFARPILLPIPTVCAINGHAFGAGMMFALGHDHRIQGTGKGYQCAIEVAIGVKTPPPELTLFRHSMSANAFYETVLEAKRWTGNDALAAGIVQQAVPEELVLDTAIKHATTLSKLGETRNVMSYFKNEVKGFVAHEILNYVLPEGIAHSTALTSSRLLKHAKIVASGTSEKTWGEMQNSLWLRSELGTTKKRRSMM